MQPAFKAAKRWDKLRKGDHCEVLSNDGTTWHRAFVLSVCLQQPRVVLELLDGDPDNNEADCHPGELTVRNVVRGLN